MAALDKVLTIPLRMNQHELDSIIESFMHQPSTCLACKGFVWVVRSGWTGICTVLDAKPVTGGLIEINFELGSYRSLPIPKARAKKEVHFVRHDCPGSPVSEFSGIVQGFEATA